MVIDAIAPKIAKLNDSREMKHFLCNIPCKGVGLQRITLCMPRGVFSLKSNPHTNLEVASHMA